MKSKSAICLIGLGIGGTLLYQNLKNGNIKKEKNQNGCHLWVSFSFVDTA